MVECDLRVTTKKYYHTFPGAGGPPHLAITAPDYKCENKTVPRQYILNRVLCNRQRAVKFCRGVPESDCRNVTNQQCKMVPKEICQPGCSQSKQCSQCDTFSRQVTQDSFWVKPTSILSWTALIPREASPPARQPRVPTTILTPS